MFLSRIDLKPAAAARADLPRLLRDSYGLHQLLWGLFSDSFERSRDFLFREEDRDRLEPSESIFRAFTLSERAPVDPSGLFRIASKPIEPALAAGNRLRFSVRVNPTVRRKDDARPNKARHDVVADAKRRLVAAGELVPPQAELVQRACVKWLVQRGADCGFTVDPSRVQADGYRQQRLHKGGAVDVRISTVDLEGVLEVTDPAVFRETWRRGLGPAKGFGCGLLLLRRV